MPDKGKSDLQSPAGTSSPAWTVVVPTRDRPRALEQCLEALQKMIPPKGGFEVIVVDDGGSADLAFVEGFSGVRLHVQANAGPAAARNAGLALARGARIAFTDDDCRPARDWLVRLDAAMDSAPDALAGGRTLNALTGNAYSAASQDLVHWLEGVPGAPFFASNNIAASRSALLAIGGFDQRFPLAAGEDRALCRSWAAAGRPFCPVLEAQVDHYHALGLLSFLRQHLRYGRGACRYRRTAGAGSARSVRQRVRNYAMLLTQPLRGQPKPSPLLRSALLGLAQLATAIGFAAEALAGREPRNEGAMALVKRSEGAWKGQQ